MTKRTKSTLAEAPLAPIAPSRRAQATLEHGLASLDRCVRNVAEQLDEAGVEYDKDLASHQAWITKHVAQIMSELRKLEADERAAANKLQPGAVAAYLRALTKDEWTYLRRDIDQSHESGSVL